MATRSEARVGHHPLRSISWKKKREISFCDYGVALLYCSFLHTWKRENNYYCPASGQVKGLKNTLTQKTWIYVIPRGWILMILSIPCPLLSSITIREKLTFDQHLARNLKITTNIPRPQRRNPSVDLPVVLRLIISFILEIKWVQVIDSVQDFSVLLL